jgi:hypothetical protein
MSFRVRALLVCGIEAFALSMPVPSYAIVCADKTVCYPVEGQPAQRTCVKWGDVCREAPPPGQTANYSFNLANMTKNEQDRVLKLLGIELHK